MLMCHRTDVSEKVTSYTFSAAGLALPDSRFTDQHKKISFNRVAEERGNVLRN